MEKEHQSKKQLWYEPQVTEIKVHTTEWRTNHHRRPPKPHHGKTTFGCGDCLWDDPS